MKQQTAFRGGSKAAPEGRGITTSMGIWKETGGKDEKGKKTAGLGMAAKGFSVD
jgi:hypothetical protein